MVPFSAPNAAIMLCTSGIAWAGRLGAGDGVEKSARANSPAESAERRKTTLPVNDVMRFSFTAASFQNRNRDASLPNAAQLYLRDSRILHAICAITASVQVRCASLPMKLLR